MHQSYNEQREKIYTRVIELEKDLESQDDFRMLSSEQYKNLLNLKKIVGEGNWLMLDDYICSKNAEYEYIINYFYINGLKDGRNMIN